MQGKESLGMGVDVRMVRGSSWLSSPIPEGGWQGRVGAEKAGSRERMDAIYAGVVGLSSGRQ